MEKIREVGDPTSIILVTGRSGRDVVSIIRDSQKKFDAYDAMPMNTLVPAELRELIAGGLGKFSLLAVQNIRLWTASGLPGFPFRSAHSGSRVPTET